MRKVSNLEAYITIQHIRLNIVIMITGSIVRVYLYFMLGIQVESIEQYAFEQTGPYWWAYW
jgi:molybdopterin-containing oxidoreductase family membrane subunit